MGYGQVAMRAGLPGRARLTARILGQNDDPDLPWHRVLRSDGRIAMEEGSAGWHEQSQRLRAEGVVVENGRVRMPATDTAAALRGSEIGAEIVLKATKVDGVYTADPKKDPSATRYTTISFDEAISRNLQVMDATAFALCRDQKLPIKVFSIVKPGALKRVILGEDEGTLVHV